MTFTPIFDRILIERDKSDLEKRTERSGIIITEQTKDSIKASLGTLIKCGDDCHDLVKAMVGKKVLFARYSGDEIKVDGMEYLLATDRDIFGLLED